MNLAAIRQRLAANVPPEDLILSTRQPVFNQAVVDFVWNQCKGPCALAEWIERRQSFYFDGPGRSWPFEALTYAACRDAACWQLKKREKDLLVPGGLVRAM